MTMNRLIAAAAAAGFALFAGVAMAQNFPSGSGNGPAFTSDPVTGYQCVTAACDVVRITEADCLCTKTNPAANNLSETRLECSTREGGQWVQCPVRPRYGG